MLVDWIRVYQHPDRINIGCDPPGFPTSDYISLFEEAYNNPNLTVCASYFVCMPTGSHLYVCRLGSMITVKRYPRTAW